MNQLINTPENIKYGLGLCATYGFCSECPYRHHGWESKNCKRMLVSEALKYTQQLEAEAAKQALRIAELEQELTAVKRERDAAVHSEWVKDGGGFTICKECGCSPADWEAKPDNPSGHPPYCHSCGAKMGVNSND